MEGYSTKELQTEILTLLKILHKICTENGIHYTLHGGSLLGAIREKGFIPWDDDGDIALFRDDYNRLKTLLNKEVYPGIYLETERDKVKKIWLKQDGKPSVWVDVFIYDYISSNIIAKKLKIICLTLLSAYVKDNISMAQFRTNKRAKGMKRIVFELIYFFSKSIPIEKRVAKFERFCEYRLVGNKKLVQRANDQLWAMPMILSEEKTREYEEVAFEDTKLMISANYDEILTQLYGWDYMTPRKPASSETEVHNISRSNAS